MDMALRRRHLLGGAGLALGGIGTVRAQGAWPSRPVRLIVGFTAGSATDVTARIAAQRYSAAFGQPFVVENVSGNSGAIGADRVAKSPPDGYTLMWTGNAAITVLPAMQNLPFDPLRDFAAITVALAMPSVFIANKDLPLRGMADLVAMARGGSTAYGTPGTGTPQHIAGEMFCHQAGIRMEHIPYRGAALADILSGAVPVGIHNAGAVLPLIRDGRLRAIGVTSLTRAATMPEIATVAEQGMPGFEAISWFGLLAPAGTDAAIQARLHAETMKLLADTDARAQFASLGLDIVGSTPQQAQATIAADIPKWAKVIADAGIPTSR